MFAVPLPPGVASMPLFGSLSGPLKKFHVLLKSPWLGKSFHFVVPLMGFFINEFEVGQVIVSPIPVDVVNMVPFRNIAVSILPHPAVKNPLLDRKSVV